MNVIITLAGESKRFIKAGFKDDKFLLKVGDQTILEKVKCQATILKKVLSCSEPLTRYAGMKPSL